MLPYRDCSHVGYVYVFVFCFIPLRYFLATNAFVLILVRGDKIGLQRDTSVGMPLIAGMCSTRFLFLRVSKKTIFQSFSEVPYVGWETLSSKGGVNKQMSQGAKVSLIGS